MRRIANMVLALTLIFTGCSLASGSTPGPHGPGWTMTRLDLDVRVARDEPSMQVQGTLTLRQDLEESLGPSLWVNGREGAMRWVTLAAPPGAKVELNATSPSDKITRYAHVRYSKPQPRGTEIELGFELELVGAASQLLARPDLAIASWIDGWYPVALREEGAAYPAGARAVPGTTTLRLPAEWIGLSDGRLLSRERNADETVEVWQLGANPVARGFAAGPFVAAERVVDGRTLRIYMRDEHPITVDRLAELLAQTMAAQEARFGTFPFDGYGVVEVPDDIEGWYAASQQTFIMAKSSAFDYEHGNIPLWGHEMCHAWWGNMVGTAGAGLKMAGEALAQVGVLIALEALEGRDAMLDFLENSRSGYSPDQCARGYFGLADEGKDHPLADLGNSSLDGGAMHNLADSKGMWVYHMLRQKVGDDAFFGTLRALARDYSGKSMRLSDIRRAFIASVPDADLEGFFAQWLDREGAVRLEATWTRRDDGSTELLLTQPRDTEPFRVDLDVDLMLADGSVHRVGVAVDGRKTSTVLALSSPIERVVLDPDRALLIWRASYGSAPTNQSSP